MHNAHASMAPFEEPAAHLEQTIQGAGHESILMPPPRSASQTMETNLLSRSQSSEGARRRPRRYMRRNAMTEGSVEAMDCVMAAMEHTEIGRISSTKEPTSLGKRRPGSPSSIDSRHNKTATFHKGTGSDNDEAITVHSDGEEPGSFSGSGRPPSTPQGLLTSTGSAGSGEATDSGG
jgi:hypothetical protein